MNFFQSVEMWFCEGLILYFEEASTDFQMNNKFISFILFISNIVVHLVDISEYRSLDLWSSKPLR